MQTPAAEIVLAPLEHRAPDLAPERLGRSRYVLREQLLLQGLRRRGDYDALARVERRNQVGQALADTGARLREEVLAALEGVGDLLRERSLLGPGLESGERGGQPPAGTEERLHRGRLRVLLAPASIANVCSHSTGALRRDERYLPQRSVRLASVGATLLAALVLSAPAPGASLFFDADSKQLRYTAALGETNVLTVTEAGGWYVFDDTGASISASTPCVAESAVRARCPTPDPDGGEQLWIELRDRDDHADLSGLQRASGLFLHVVKAGYGEDTLLAGQGGSLLSGGCGRDLLRGGRGNDLLSGDREINSFGCRGRNEDTDRLLGGPGRDLLEGGGRGDILRGGPGDDYLSGRKGADEVEGNTGADYVFGNEGADILRGRRGNDAVAGGTGRDTLLGGAGADRLFAADLWHDRLDGGPGKDGARMDSLDVVRAAERIRLFRLP